MNGLTKLALHARQDIRNAIRSNVNGVGDLAETYKANMQAQRGVRLGRKPEVALYGDSVDRLVGNAKKKYRGAIRKQFKPTLADAGKWVSKNKKGLGIGAAGIAGAGGLGLLLKHLANKKTDGPVVGA